MTEAALWRRERKKEETKRRIFEAAIKLFNEKGFDAATVDEIAERADVAKGTFFNYFPRKEAVLEYLSGEWLELAEDQAAAVHLPAAERIINLFAAAAGSYGENRELTRLVVRSSMQQMCCPEPEGACDRLDQLFEDIFRDGVARGEFRADVEPHSAFGVCASVFLGTLLWWVGTADGRLDPAARDVSLPDAVRHQLSVVFDGLRAPRVAEG